MLLTADIEHKTIGNKLLFKELCLAITGREKVAISGMPYAKRLLCAFYCTDILPAVGSL